MVKEQLKSDSFVIRIGNVNTNTKFSTPQGRGGKKKHEHLIISLGLSKLFLIEC